MSKSPLQRLIALEEVEDSEGRREVLREVTDSFMVASDRYGRREMALFDLVLPRTASAMDRRLRRLFALALVRAGGREEHVRMILSEIGSPNERFLRRSVTKTKRDLLETLREQADPADFDGDPALDDGSALRLPKLLLAWCYHYLVCGYRDSLRLKIGAERADVLERTASRFREEITEAAAAEAQDEIVTARRTVADWAKREAITDVVLADLLEARAMTEFIFALMNTLNLDASTTVRILNDTSFESFAVAARSGNMRRSVFAKTIHGFKNRRTDQNAADRILSLYGKLDVENAERAMRFWRLRVAEHGGLLNDLDASDRSNFAASA